MGRNERISSLLHYLVPCNDDSVASLPYRMQRALAQVKPDKILIFNNHPLVLYFKTADTLSIDDIFKRYWNFSESPIVLIENDSAIDVYNGFEYVLKNKKPVPLELKSEGLSYDSLISGKFFEDTTFKKPKNKIDTVLLQNIKDARDKLIALSQGDKKTVTSIVNALLGRVIFIRYLIDRNIALYYDGTKRTITNDDFKEILLSKTKTYQLFKDLQSSDKGFNGNWFPIEKSEEETIEQKHLDVLKELISGTEIKSGQRSLFDYYDFSIIPIEFISNVYENFIGEKEQKRSGAYYTPTFLVDYILKHTVDTYFEQHPDTYSCKVLDPACGSGIFLVETYRKLVARYEKVTGKKPSQTVLKTLALENIFGIDHNKNALQISIFSLYLAMLDYQEPKDLEHFTFPKLDKNFFENDFFDTKAEFNKILEEKKIDFIVGNPPYGRGGINKASLAQKYIKDNNIAVSGKEIVQPFMARVKDFKDTQAAFIVTSKVFYNLKAKDFREYFLKRFKIKHILELSSVRKEIFKNADTPVSIIFYQKATKEEIEKNTVYYISMKPSPYFEKTKFLLLSRQDFKKVAQSKLLEYDYLWKILVYGSYLDFNFIRRIESENHKTLQEYVDEKILFKFQGFKRKDGNKKIPTAILIGYDFINTKKKHLKPFWVSNVLDTFEYEYVGYINKSLLDNFEELYEPPILLLTGGLSNHFRQTSAISYKKTIFNSSVVALKPKKKDIALLQNINGLLYSTFFSYFMLQKAASSGIIQEESDDHDKLSIPVKVNNKIISTVKKIEAFQKNHFENGNALTLGYEEKLQKLIENLDRAVLEAFELNDQEKALIDYATTIVIPWVIQKNYQVAFSHYAYQDKRIEEYVDIFLRHYVPMYEENDLFFQATIYWSKYAIGIYFKILQKKQDSRIVWKKEEKIEHYLRLMQGKTLENLFVQKDIKGFEKDGFYAVKPNEIKNWHKAIGYLDFYEFEDAILRAGR